MPIPMPPPPPPYVAPDLRPIVARGRAELTFLRGRGGGRVVARRLEHGLWIAAEGAPLELRMHRRGDGSVWAEQATYAAGDRQGGIARASAGADVQVLSRRLVGRMGEVANLVRYSIVDQVGRELRSWSPRTCSPAATVRLDRADSPEEPTYPGSWEGCDPGFGSTYVLGRLVAVDRGWAMRAPATADGVAPLPDGSYLLRIQLDPLQGIADSDRTNDVATMPLRVRTVTGAVGDGGGVSKLPGMLDPARDVRPREVWDAAEPHWYARELRNLERAVAARRARREAGPAPRVGEAPPAPPPGVDLPDLRVAPSYGIRTDSVRRRNGSRRDLLRFGGLTWNAGPGPLEVEAFRETGTTLGAYQVFTRDGRRSTRQARGTLVWHAAPGHDHFHFAAFARYQLTALDGRVVRDGGKHSWCIVDTDLVDATTPGAVPPSRTAAGDCGSDPGSLWARLSLSVGSGDYYGPDIAGQAFDVSTLPNGSYRIRIEANPTGVIAEADHANNASTRVVRLGGVRGARTVVPRPVPTLAEEADECAKC